VRKRDGPKGGTLLRENCGYYPSRKGRARKTSRTLIKRKDRRVEIKRRRSAVSKMKFKKGRPAFATGGEGNSVGAEKKKKISGLTTSPM